VGPTPEDPRDGLPLHFKRPFRLWAYEVSHRRLVLRSEGAVEAGATLEVEFLDVLGVKVRSNYRDLLISEAVDVSEIDQFADVPERHSSRYLRLVVSDGVHKGFVVCGSFRVQAGQ
jgi:hypothetical protein